MRYKWIYGVLALFVSALMLMPSVFAATGPPIVWAGQATLSTVDGLPSQDPENSGFGTTQVVVWEEWNGADWDIMMRYNLFDGAPLLWTPAPPAPPIIVAGTPLLDEINPAVTVTNFNPATGFQEVHVVYQCANLVWPGTWDVCHTWTNLPAIAWSPLVILDVIPQLDARDPAIVFTEDLSPGPGGGGVPGMLVQFVWSEWNPVVLPLRYEIQYDAYYFDPNRAPVRNYVGTTLIRSCPFGSCEYPEIVSVDETLNVAAYDYYFAVVWEEPIWINPPGRFQINVWYNDGTTITSPGLLPITVLTPGSLGQLNPVNIIGDSYHPDIAATQDYVVPPGIETYYFHVNWVYNIWAAATFQIDTCYAVGAVPTPGAAAFIPTGAALGPVAFVLDNPTIASKLVLGVPPPVFETWMCWEDNNPGGPSPTDIWYRVGQWNAIGFPPFAYTVPAAFVPYGQPVGSSEFNPELWNRNDSIRPFPPPALLTHLVFDMLQFGAQEIEYIDP